MVCLSLPPAMLGLGPAMSGPVTVKVPVPAPAPDLDPEGELSRAAAASGRSMVDGGKKARMVREDR